MTQIKTAFIADKINGITVKNTYKADSTNYKQMTARVVNYVIIHYTGNIKDKAVNNAKLSVTESGTFTINLLRGDYNATANFNWDASLRTKTLVIEGNGLVLNGNNQYRFITVSNHCTLKLNNIK